MSNTDKTRRMLMSSMKKTRAGTQANQTSARSTTPTVKKKTTARKTTAKKTASKKASARKPVTSSQAITDPYQSKGRVWPD